MKPHRLACVHVRRLPLQLLLQRRPTWQDRPVAVVDADTATAGIGWVNAQARRAGVQTGMRYVAALALSPTLHADTVDTTEINAAVDTLHRKLLDFSPFVEPSYDEPGLFWLDAEGLENLYPSLRQWGEAIQTELTADNWAASVVVGFSRFGSYALAKTRRNVAIVPTPQMETNAYRRIGLHHFDLPKTTLATLHKLDIKSIGALIDLPASSIRSRFDDRVWTLYNSAAKRVFRPLHPVFSDEPMQACSELVEPDDHAERLLFLSKRLLDRLLQKLRQIDHVPHALEMQLALANGGYTRRTLQAATATWQPRIWIDLLRLYFEQCTLSAPVTAMTLTATTEKAIRKSLSLPQTTSRDLAAGAHALAQLRSEFGNDCVTIAKLLNGQLPVAQEQRQHCRILQQPRSEARPKPQTIRRLHTIPKRLTQAPFGHPKPDKATRLKTFGAYLLCGGWWQQDVRREYHYVKQPQGALGWLYYDPLRGHWYEQGRVE